MKRRIFGVLFAAGVALAPGLVALADDSWPTYSHDASSSNYNGSERIVGPRSVPSLHLAWTAAVGEAQSVLVTGGRVYVVAPATVRILDASTGRSLNTITRATLGVSATEYASGATVTGGRLIVATGEHVVALSLDGRRVLWRSHTGASFLTSTNGIVYTGKGCQNEPKYCGDLASYAIDVSTGRVLWRHPGNGGGLPVIAAGRLYQLWGTEGGPARVYDPRGGALLATLPFGDASRWFGDARRVYVEVFSRGNDSTTLSRVDASSRRVWSVPLGRSQTAFGAYDGALAYVPSDRHHTGVVGVNGTTGKVVWAANTGPLGDLTAANGLIFVRESGNARLDVVRASDGTPLRHITLPRAIQGPNGTSYVQVQAIAGGAVYEGGDRGVAAYRP